VIPITGPYLPLYLMYKIDKNLGTEKFLVYLAAGIEAKKRGLVKVKIPDSFSGPVNKRIEDLGAGIRGDGWVVVGNGRGYHGKDVLPEVLTHTTGLSNLVAMQATIGNKYPGSLEAIGLGTNEGESVNKISSMLDKVADSLEAKGYIKEAYEVDKVADKIEAIAMNMGSPSVVKEPYDEKDWKKYQHKGIPGLENSCPMCQKPPQGTHKGEAYHFVHPINTPWISKLLKSQGIVPPYNITDVLDGGYGSDLIDETILFLTKEQANNIPPKLCNDCLKDVLKKEVLWGIDYLTRPYRKVTFDHGIEKEGWPGEQRG
jgi:hypothetical protein